MAFNGCLLLGSLQICGPRSLGLSASQAQGLGKPGQDSGPRAPVRLGRKPHLVWSLGHSLSLPKPLNLRALERAWPWKQMGLALSLPH